MTNDNLTAIIGIYDNETAAKQAKSKLESGINEKLIKVEDLALVSRDKQGKMHVQTHATAVKKGTVLGGTLGFALSALAGPGGLLLSTAAGAFLGRYTTQRVGTVISREQAQGLKDYLRPGMHALVVVTDVVWQGEAERRLANEQGFVTALSIDSEEEQAVPQPAEIHATPALAPPYPRMYVIINPASGKNEPILNTLNDVFHAFDIQWDVGLTHQYGDAQKLARQAAESGQYDLVVGYGGDGTQHEIVNGLMHTGITMGILPGGTGNGLGTGLGVPRNLSEAALLLCQSRHTRSLDVAAMRQEGEEDTYFIQRLYAGIEPEQQTSREMKDKYGPFAYFISLKSQIETMPTVDYKLTIDGQEITDRGQKCYIVNSATTGSGLSIDVNFQPDDGLLDVFVVGRDMETIKAASARFLQLPTAVAGMHYWRGKTVTLETTPSQALWYDGEFAGRTPVTVEVLPGAIKVAVPLS